VNRNATYVEAALRRECAAVANAPRGERNSTLNRSAFSLGQLVGGGVIERSRVECNLFAAAQACGYVANDGAAAARATIRSGLDRGELKPRQVRLDGWRVTRNQPWASVLSQDELPHSEDGEANRERAKAQRFWRQRQPIAGTIAEIYLRQARCYRGEIIPATLGFLPARGDHPPALIAAFGVATEPQPGALAIADNAVMAVQLVKLKPDGSGKADSEPQKIIIGKGALGSPIVLAPPNDLLGVSICEGAEDALSVHEATGLGAWASGGATRMPALAGAVPAHIECVNIFGHDDDTGRRNATELGARLTMRGFEVILKFLRGASTQ
jgi:hypothetical protein